MFDIEAPDVDSAHMRRAGKELLSLALMDARNHTLRWFAAFERALELTALKVPLADELEPPLWLLGHAGWYQERWIARNVQRHRGTGCDPTLPRLASLLPQADDWYDPARGTHDERWVHDLPDAQATRQYLVDTLEMTLELLYTAHESDDALYFYRLALFHEDALCETFARLSQTLGFDAGLLPAIAAVNPRPALYFPATRWRLGSEPGAGFVYDNEKWAHEVAVPEFEIDAQPVSWAQYAEFVEDGGYDRAELWGAAGWDWVQRLGRRSPRHVDQLRHGVLQQRLGRLMRVPMAQPVLHVSWHEADAWCRWAGRRLPTEVEWEAAAHQGASRGWRWGDVWEWTASTFRPWPGFAPDPDRDHSQPCFGTHKVLRGASFATRGRARHLKLRRFHRPERDDLFCGFRSCAA